MNVRGNKPLQKAQLVSKDVPAIIGHVPEPQSDELRVYSPLHGDA